MGRKGSRRIPVETLSADAAVGLTSRQAEERLHCGWSNRASTALLRPDGQIILRHCATFFNLIFIIMAVFLMLAGSTIIKLSFLVVVIINTVIGCVQEIRAKRAVEKLTLLAEQTLHTVRDGKIQIIPSSLLVRDDIVEFVTGDQICADGVLRDGELFVNEALVTGEEDTVVKHPGDRLLSGSVVIAGTGRVQLTQVGDDAFAARLSAEAKKNPQVAKSEMMRSLDKLIRVMGIVLIPIGGFLFCHEYFVLGRGLRIGVESTAAALVGMIPEGLYLLTSIALAVSSLKLAKQRVLAQDMNCIETLARVDVLCVDKTGTITEPAMEVDSVIPLSGDPSDILTAMYGTREPENDTARALFQCYQGASLWESVDEIPFTSQAKWYARNFKDRGWYVAGAPDRMMAEPYTLEAQVTAYTQTGLRVLLVARYGGDLRENYDASLLTPVALVLLRSRIRKDAEKTFAFFKEQGVAVKVISGDDPRTVSAIAQRSGIAHSDAWIDAATLTTDEALAAAAEKYTVFGRVLPEQKRVLIRALKNTGHTVAMTGDGVNDVLAMKDAHCSIAMASGAQAAGQVAQLVLLDSDFSAMPHIVNEGRRVINNIQRTAALFLVKNIFSMGITLLTLLLGRPYPMEPQHMTLISGLTIGFPAFFLALEANYTRVTGRFLPTVLRRALPGGLTDVACVFAVQTLLLQLPSRQISTIATVTLATVGLWVLLQVCRPFDKFRLAVWAAMAVALAGSFSLLQWIFEFQFSAVTLTLLPLIVVAVPVVYTLISYPLHCLTRLSRRNKLDQKRGTLQ